ncbi:hypothetical protein BU15DRAFT_69637, partial [Melanogaster broomeanus]
MSVIPKTRLLGFNRLACRAEASSDRSPEWSVITQLMPTVSYTSNWTYKGKDKAGEDRNNSRGIRFFLKDIQRNIVGTSFVENQRADAPSMSFPVQWNVPLTEQHIRRTK